MSNLAEEHLWLPFRRDILISTLLEKGAEPIELGEDILLENMRLYVDSQKDYVEKNPVFDSANEYSSSAKKYFKKIGNVEN